MFLQRVQCQLCGHAGLDLDLLDAILKGDHLRTVVTELSSIDPAVNAEKIFECISHNSQVQFAEKVKSSGILLVFGST